MGIISTDLKPYYSEDRTDRIRTIEGPPVLVWIVYTSQFQKFIGLGVETAQVRRGSRSFLGLGQLRWSLKTFRPSDSFLGLACLIVSENKEESLSSVRSSSCLDHS